MKISAHLKNARMTPRKLRLWRKVVVGLPVAAARAQLQWQPGKGARIILDVLNSAAANAVHNLELTENNLRVLDVRVNEGLTFKRFRPVSRGMAHAYVKRTSHVTVALSEITPQARARARAAAEIDTVAVDELPKEREPERITDRAELATGGVTPPGGPSATEEAYQRTKMLQQGGDRKKTHRRKSM